MGLSRRLEASLAPKPTECDSLQLHHLPLQHEGRALRWYRSGLDSISNKGSNSLHYPGLPERIVCLTRTVPKSKHGIELGPQGSGLGGSRITGRASGAARRLIWRLTISIATPRRTIGFGHGRRARGTRSSRSVRFFAGTAIGPRASARIGGRRSTGLTPCTKTTDAGVSSASSGSGVRRPGGGCVRCSGRK